MYMPNGTQHFSREVIVMTNQLHLNQTVRNFGVLAKVAGFHDITGDPILRPLWNDGTTWLGNAKFCEPVGDEPATTVQHKDGLVCFG
jgi:hypothetical protein